MYAFNCELKLLFLPSRIFSCGGPTFTALDAIRLNIGRKGKIFTRNSPVLALDSSAKEEDLRQASKTNGKHCAVKVFL